MEKSPFNISQSKFLKLSGRGRHKLLSLMALMSLESGDVELFLRKYEELHSWSELDRYEPPEWLSVSEALQNYHDFHSDLASIKPPVRSEQIPWQATFPVEIVMDQVRSVYNVGSVIRMIDNFGFKRLVHSTPTLSLNHPRLKRSAMGCQNWIPVKYEKDLYQYLENLNIPLIGIEATDDALTVQEWNPPEQCSLLVGNETYGIAEALLKLCSQKVFVPMHGFKKSMNVTHALAVVSAKLLEKIS